MLVFKQLFTFIKARCSIEIQWRRISCKQSVRWQHLSWSKASVFLSLQKNI